MMPSPLLFFAVFSRSIYGSLSSFAVFSGTGSIHWSSARLSCLCDVTKAIDEFSVTRTVSLSLVTGQLMFHTKKYIFTGQIVHFHGLFY